MKKFLFVLLCTLPVQVFAIAECARVHFEGEFLQLDGIWTELQTFRPGQKRALVIQSDYDNFVKPTGGGACATATGANGLQLLWKLSGAPRTVDLDQAIHRAFTAVPELQDGRVTNSQFQQMWRHFNRYFPENSLKFEVQQAGWRRQPTDPREWRVFTSANLDGLFHLGSKEIKILAYRVTSLEGKILGRHFVVLKQWLPPSTLVVVDPNKPEKSFSYSLIKTGVEGTDSFALQLVRPPAANGAPTAPSPKFELDTVFTIGLGPKE